MLHRAFQTYGHYKGPLDKVRKGVLISMAGLPLFLQAVNAFAKQHCVCSLPSTALELSASSQHSVLAIICPACLYGTQCACMFLKPCKSYCRQAAIARRSIKTFWLHLLS